MNEVHSTRALWLGTHHDVSRSDALRSASTIVSDVLPAVVRGPRKFQYQAESNAEAFACQKNRFGAALRKASALAGDGTLNSVIGVWCQESFSKC